MATLKESIVTAIKPCCRNRACAEQAADVAIKLVEEKFTSTNSSSREIPSFVECMAHVRGMQHWSMSERPVVECQKLYDYIARNIGR